MTEQEHAVPVHEVISDALEAEGYDSESAAAIIDAVLRDLTAAGYVVSRPSQAEAGPVLSDKPSAWLGWVPGAGSVDSYTTITRHRSTMEKWGSCVEVTPLYAVRRAPSRPIQAGDEVGNGLVAVPSCSRVKHKKRGTTHQVLDVATIQSDEPLHDGNTVVVYRCEGDGRLWAHRYIEMHDGRFEVLSAAKGGASNG